MAAAGGGDADREEILELYRLAVEAVMRVSAQRGAANAFHLTVRTAFASVLGLSLTTPRDLARWVTPAISLVGVVLSVSWWLRLRGYRDLNRAEIAVIHDLETRLPVAVFTAEWRHLGGDRGGDRDADGGGGAARRYTGPGAVEQTVPFAFGVLHLAIGAGGLARGDPDARQRPGVHRFLYARRG
ncbi:RipA family octameric membrane protein [Streptomyces sp. URMC 129]|uniref:RipA family octameric membrane protein n=1 Tax=Streptomyces sp. URMC 129 TaxID=3423407 RepID=UPI003F1A337B